MAACSQPLRSPYVGIEVDDVIENKLNIFDIVLHHCGQSRGGFRKTALRVWPATAFVLSVKPTANQIVTVSPSLSLSLGRHIRIRVPPSLHLAAQTSARARPGASFPGTSRVRR